MNRFTKPLLAFLLTAVLACSGAQAQNEDFDKLFGEMMQEFFPPELRKEIEGLRNNYDSTGETKSFFKDSAQFRDLKQREIQNRRLDRVEKQHSSNLLIFRPISGAIANSVYGLYPQGREKRIAFGTAITKELMVTKADRLEGLKKVVCRTRSGDSFSAEIVDIDTKHDLAILRSERSLFPISEVASSYDEGTILVTVANETNPVAMGTLAVKPRSIIGSNRGFLGVEPGPALDGVRIQDVTPNSAALRAGVRRGDIVTRIDAIMTRSVADLVRAIGSKKQGEEIKLSVLRNGQSIQLSAVLDGRNKSGDRAARFEMMRRLGAVLSRRHDEFPNVLEHDTPILPDQAGSPIVDIEKKVVGINIARASRTSSYALPIDLVVRLVKKYESSLN